MVLNGASNKKIAVIIGAGMGGIATSVFLAQNGYEVRVYEKNLSPGGRCGQTIRDGHRFDLGATIFLMPSVYRKVFNSLGLTLEDCIETRPLSTIYKIYFDDGTELAFTTDNNKMKSQLEAIESGSFQNMQSYISKGYELFQVALNKLIGRNFYHLLEFANLKNTLLLIKLKTYIRHHTYIRKFFRHPHLKMAFTFQNIYVGQSPFKSPALFSMLPAAELTEGSLFPTGGMHSIANKLVSIATDLGVQFNYNKSVVKIVVDKNKARCIILDDGAEIFADIIIANADLPYVYRELLPDKNVSLRLDRKKYSCSAIVFHWGLDKVYPQIGHHSVFLSEDYRVNLEQIFNEKSLADKPSFYVHAPTRTDPSAAPADQDSISVIVPVGHIDEKHDQDWNKFKHIARLAVLDRLKKHGMEDIEKHIKFEICYLPNTWQNIYNISKGSVFGSLNHSTMQMGYFRPHNRHNRYKNLYFVGGSTHPGNGVPLVLLSAKLTSERILKEANTK
jgi:phytoene desaturase